MGENISLNISKKLIGKYCQKPLHLVKKSAPDLLKTVSKRAVQKAAEAKSDLLGNKVTNKFKKNT